VETRRLLPEFQRPLGMIDKYLRERGIEQKA
jgi:hypothetical protein